MTSVKRQGATASSRVYTGSDDEEGEEDSAILADLAAMFPNIEHSELVTVFRSHGGDTDATVDYLVALSLHNESGGPPLTSLDEDGQYSSEIGSLPKVIPMQTDSDSDEEDIPVNQAGNNVSGDKTHLLTYSEGMNKEEGYCVAGSILRPLATNQRSLIEGQPPGSQNGNGISQKKKRKRKKLKNLAGKLSSKKERSADYKTEMDSDALERGCQMDPLLQPLIKSDELELERVAT